LKTCRSNPTSSKKHNLLVIALIIAAFLGSFYAHKQRVPKRGYADFHCFYTAGERLSKGENIYVLRDQKAAEFRYAPVFALLMSGLAFLNEDNADTLWYIINFCLLILSLMLLKKLVSPRSLQGKSLFIIYALTLLGIFRFIQHNFDSGQSNILMLFSLILGLYFILRDKELPGGFILAFSAMIKYTPLIFIPYFIARRRLKLSLVIIFSIIIYLSLPGLFVGFKNNLLYLKSLPAFLTQSTIFDQMTVLDPKNQSLFSAIHRIFTYCIAYFYAPHMPFETSKLSPQAINLIFLASATVIYLAVFIPAKNQLSSKINLLIDCAQLLICVVLFNLNSWMHNYLLLSLAYFIIAYYLASVRFKDLFVLILLLASYALNIATLGPMFNETIRYKLQFYSPFTLSGLITFLALLKIKFLPRDEIKEPSN
jgi:hypothetical protein